MSNKQETQTFRWPLPGEWATLIPPQPINIVEQWYFGAKIQAPVWNEQWLRGLEAFIRGIVRDELSKANTLEADLVETILNKGTPS